MSETAGAAPGAAPDARRVLVTGVTGFLGPYVLRELHAHGYALVGSGRDAAKVEAALPEGATALIGDLASLTTASLAGTSPAVDAGVVDAGALDAIVHCAALSSPWGPWRDFRRANVDGTAAVIELARRNGVRRIVFVSSPSVYATPHDRLNITEGSVDPRNRLNNYIRSKIAAEALLQRALAAGDIGELVIIRPRGLVGAEDPSLVPRLLRANERVGIPLFNGGTNLVDLTAVENVALALRLALETKAADGRAYNITNGEPREFGALVEWLFGRMGVTPRFRRLNRPFAYAAAAALEALYLPLGARAEPPLTRYTLSTIAFSQTLDIAKARAELGYSPRVSLDDALERVAAAHGRRDG